MKGSVVAIVLLVTLNSGCDDSVDPGDRFEPRMVIYGVLSSETSTQIIRVYSNYNPPDYDPAAQPADPVVRDAVVQISDGTQVFSFTDTVFARKDTSRYRDSIYAYVANGFRPESGKTYTLMVTSPTHGALSQTTTMPGNSVLQVFGHQSIANPWCNSAIPAISYVLYPPGGGYVARMLIEYEENYPGVTLTKYQEVPSMYMLIDPLYSLYAVSYPGVQRKDSPGAKSVSTQWSRANYITALGFVNDFAYNHKFKRAVFVVIQYNEAWYKYYQFGRAFKDPLSIRLDEPDYTNIPGGLGLFAGYTVDSIAVPIPCIMTAPRADVGCPFNVQSCP